MVEIHKTYDKALFEPLHQLLLNVAVPTKSVDSNRRGFPLKHRAMVLGVTRGRYNGVVGLSYCSKKYPKIYAEVLKLGQLLCPFPFTSIHLNNNVICPKHLDSKNVGRSMLVSFGDYEGCNIVVQGVTYDAKHTPLIFNGAELEHWNTDDLKGNKYSLVFYNAKFPTPIEPVGGDSP